MTVAPAVVRPRAAAAFPAVGAFRNQNVSKKGPFSVCVSNVVEQLNTRLRNPKCESVATLNKSVAPRNIQESRGSPRRVLKLSAEFLDLGASVPKPWIIMLQIILPSAVSYKRCD